MKQVLQYVKDKRLVVEEIPDPVVRAGGVLVRNRASLISAGTEKMVMDFARKSLLGKARARPDLVRQVIDKVKREGIGATLQTVSSKLEAPIPLGYSCAGVIEQLGDNVSGYRAGQRVACAGMGYASHADIVFVPKNLIAPIPDDVSFEDAAYVTVGAIALHGVRMAAPTIGERVAVIGLGIIGQITAQILRGNGCQVFGIDIDAARVQQAIQRGADDACTTRDDVAARIAAFTEGMGADAVIIAAGTSSDDTIRLAGEIARDRATVVAVGAVGLDVPRKLFYDKELTLRISRSYGPGRYDSAYEMGGHDYPIAYVRWTEQRNMGEFLRLVARGVVKVGELTTHSFPIERGIEAFDLVENASEPFLGVLLTYSSEPASSNAVVRLREPKARPGIIGVGAIGAGNFGRAVLLPAFAKKKQLSFIGVATAAGISARVAAERFGFGYATTDVAKLLEDSSIDAVIIATRHNLHADLAGRALRAGKSVFVEKPLALDEPQLAALLEAERSAGGILTVGFNRRYSSHALAMRAALPRQPMAIQYRINAGEIPASSWIQDREEGGGRIIGEVCHFLDLIQFLTGELPHKVAASLLRNAPDSAAIIVEMNGGSVATISYFTTGDRSYSKERVEAYCGGVIAILDDFRELTIVRDGKRRRSRSTQDKGFDAQAAAFIDGVRQGTPPIAIESLIATTRATFAIEQALRTGQTVEVTL